MVVSAPEHQSERGIEGRAELVIEIRSPHDESWEKLAFFAEMGIPEVLILDADDPVVLRLAADGASYVRVASDDDGWRSLAVLPVRLRTEPGGGIAMRTPGAVAVI